MNIMISQEKKKQVEDRYFIAIEKLFDNVKFAEEIKSFRVKVGIPENGYKTFEEYYTFLKTGDIKEKHILHLVTIVPFLFNLSIKYKYPSNHVYWVEAFFALGYNYKKFENQIPFHRQREYFIYGPTCNLDISDLSDDHMNLAIYPGATLNSIRDFLSENWGFIETMLKVREDTFGKTPSVRKSKQDDIAKIVELADKGELNSSGIYVPKIKDKSIQEPDCIINIKQDQRKRRVVQGRKTKKIRNQNS